MATNEIKYLDKHGVGTVMRLLKSSVSRAYYTRGQAIYADAGFLGASANDKEAVAVGASTIDSAGVWQLINNTWTKITSFEEGYVYDIINSFITDSNFREGAGHAQKEGVNIAVVNVGTTASPTLMFDLLSGLLGLDEYQTKALVAPLVTFENEVTTEYTASADLPTSEEIASATVTEHTVAIIGGSSTEAGDVYRAHVEVDSNDNTLNSITWIKLGNQETVEGVLSLLSNTAPNTPITDAEIEELWANA